MRTVLLLAVLVLPLASAQGVFMTDELTGTTNAGTTSYAMTAPSPPEAGKAYVATAFGALAYTTAFNYEVETEFTPTGDVTGTAFISCDTETVFRPGVEGQASTARMEFARGGTVLATGNLYSLRTCDGPSDVWEAKFVTSALVGETFAAGSTFTLNLILWVPTGNPGSGAENVYVLVGPDFPSGATGDGLPTGLVPTPEPVEPSITYGNFTDGFRHTWTSARNGTFLLNTTIDGPTRLALDVSVTRGRGTVVVTDANGTVAFDGVLENATTTLKGAPGQWLFNVTYHDFIGDVGVTLSAVPTTSPSPTMTNTTASDGNSTIEDQESPGLGPLAIVAAVFVGLRRFRPSR